MSPLAGCRGLLSTHRSCVGARLCGSNRRREGYTRRDSINESTHGNTNGRINGSSIIELLTVVP